MKKEALLLLALCGLLLAQWGKVPEHWGDFQMGLVNNGRTHWDQPMKDALSVEENGKRPYQLDRQYIYIADTNDIKSYWGKDNGSDGNWSKQEFFLNRDVNPAIVIYMLQGGGDSWWTIKENCGNKAFMKKYFETIKLIVDSTIGTNPIYVMEPDVWGYVLQSAREGDWSKPVFDSVTNNYYKTNKFEELKDNHLEVECHINDLGLDWLEEFDNKLSNLPGAIIKTIKYHDPDAYAGILMAYWAWKPEYEPSIGELTKVGLFQNEQGYIDITAEQCAKFCKTLLDATPYRGDFIGVEKNGTDQGYWDEKDDTPDKYDSYAEYLDWDTDDMRQWLELSKTIGQTVDLPLIGWQIAVGHRGLPNTLNSYRDSFFPHFFDYFQEFLDAGFIGMLAGAANQDRGTIPVLKGKTYTNTSFAETTAGDDGWFYGRLKTFNEQRPYLNKTDIVTTTTVSSVTSLQVAQKRNLLHIESAEKGIVTLFSMSGRAIKSKTMIAGETGTVSTSGLSQGVYLLSFEGVQSTLTQRVLIQ